MLETIKNGVDFKSSNIERISYDHETLKLNVIFQNGGEYEYDKVFPNEWEVIKGSESKGKALESQVKRNHNYRRIEKDGGD
jgi:hypothetical protein